MDIQSKEKKYKKKTNDFFYKVAQNVKAAVGWEQEQGIGQEKWKHRSRDKVKGKKLGSDRTSTGAKVGGVAR